MTFDNIQSNSKILFRSNAFRNNLHAWIQYQVHQYYCKNAFGIANYMKESMLKHQQNT